MKTLYSYGGLFLLYNYTDWKENYIFIHVTFETQNTNHMIGNIRKLIYYYIYIHTKAYGYAW